MLGPRLNIGVSVVPLVLLAGLLAACGKQAEPPAPPPPEVAVQTAAQGAAPLELTYTAHTTGSREVEVRARVGGILLKRRYEEGSRVKEGQTLFQIDPEPIRARAAAARAAVSVAQAQLDEARRQRERVLPLFEKNAVSQSRRDEAVSGYDVAAANLAAAQANQRTSELDLEYSDVRAPIAGLTSHETISEGSLVSTEKDSSLLTKIVQVDPLYVEFSMPESEAALVRASLAPANQAARPIVKLLLETGEEYPEAAKLTFVDNAVDTTSGTVRARAVLANPEAKLLPGQFIRARIEGVSLANVIVVPRKSVMSGAQGRYVWVVAAEDKVESRPVQIGRGMGNNILVTQGLAAGDRYIVDGVLKVHPGVKVNAVSVDAAVRQAEGAKSKEANQGKEPA